MKNRIIAAVLSLLIGAPLYLLAAHAAPAQPVSAEAPAELTAFLHSVPAAAELITAAALVAAGPLIRILGDRVEAVITRLLGVLLAALAAQYVIDGLRGSFGV